MTMKKFRFVLLVVPVAIYFLGGHVVSQLQVEHVVGAQHVGAVDDPPASSGPPVAAGGDVRVLTHEESSSPHLAMGAPRPLGATDEHVVVRSGYALAYSPTRHGPVWASWRLRSGDFGGQGRHRGRFVTDDSLPEAWGYRVTHADYTDSGYQRGHLVPSDERTNGASANDQTFLLSNVAPMTGSLNDGAWKTLEEFCRKLSQHDGRELSVLAGPIYGAKPKAIGHGVPVPDGFWKVVVVMVPGETAADVTSATRLYAVVMPNTDAPRGKTWVDYRTTIADVERRSGYELLGRVPELVRETLETRVPAGP